MPSSERSLRITDAYRSQLVAIRIRAERVVEGAWWQVSLADLEATAENFLGAASTAVADAQLRATRLTAGYLTAFVSSELGRRVPLVSVDARAYAGRARDGRPLAEAYDTARIGTLVALRDGRPNDEALNAGRARALLATGLDVMQAARQSLQDALIAHPRVEGYRRAVSGTCGACVAASEGVHPTGSTFHVHPGCQCVPEPVVSGVPDRVPRLTGPALFASMSTVEQDDALGAETAELVRSGEVALGDLVQRNRLANEPDFITQAPLRALT